VVESGPYRVLRHPSYTGALLLFAGLQLMRSSSAGLALALVGLPLHHRRRMADEEGLLLAALGDEDEGYRRRTARLIAGLW